MKERVEKQLVACKQNFESIRSEIQRSEMQLAQRRADLSATAGAIQVLELLLSSESDSQKAN